MRREERPRRHLKDFAQQAEGRSSELQLLTETSEARVVEESSLAALTAGLQGKLTATEVVEGALEAITEFLGAPVGAVYVLEEDKKLHRYASRALPPEADNTESICTRRRQRRPGGPLPQTLLQVTLPDGSYPVAFGFGSASSQQVVTFPLIASDELTGVLELCLLAALSEVQTRWLEKAAEITATSLRFAQEDSVREQAEERTRLILESSGEGIFGLDAEGRATFANPAACELLGFAPEELINQTAHRLIHHSHADGSPYAIEESPMRAAFTTGVATTIDDEVPVAQGGKRHPR